MRIAVVGHVRHPIAPPFEGGMEAHTWHLAGALAARGHDVTLMASGDSVPPPGVRLVPSLAAHYDRAFPWHDFAGTDTLNALVDAAFEGVSEALLGGGFDVVHNNSLHRFPPRLARAHGLAMLTALHIPPFDVLERAVRDGAAPWSRFTVTSAAQIASWWPGGLPPTASVVHNGIDPALWPYRAGLGSGAVWAGRITPTKGTHLAVEAALLAGVELTIFGAIEHREYFETAIAPRLGAGIRYGGHLEGAALARAFGQAAALLFTPCWDEPFGLTAIEAMSTGAAVAGIDRGAVGEVIGEAGALAPPGDPEALGRALVRAMTIPRRVPRDRVLRLFTLERMVDGYEALYAACRAAAPGLSARAARD